MSFLDTLTSAFKGGGEPRVPIARGFVSPWSASFEDNRSRRHFDYQRCLREGFVANPVAQRSVRIVAEGVGSAPLRQLDPAITELVSATSAGQSLLETVAAHLLLHGNAYIQVMKDGGGQPVELFALRPERVRIVPGENGWPTGYEYRIAGRMLTIPLEDEDGWPNLIHIRGIHPGDDHYGAGALTAADAAIAIHNAASEWNHSLLDNAARPSGALTYDPADGVGLTGEQYDRLKDELSAAYQGQANAGRPMLLEGGLKWQSMALSPADMDFAGLKAAAARDIALAFGVPPMLLGLPGDNSYANYREANRALWRLTLLPLAGKILSGLAEGLATWFPEAALSVDLDRVPALSEDRERLWAQVSDAKFLTEDEKRTMLGLPAKPDSKGGAK